MSDQDTPQSPDSSAHPPMGAARHLWRMVRIPLAVVVALVTAGGLVLTAHLQATGNLEIEKERFRAQLVLKAIDPKDENERRKNLAFLLKTGLLQDKDGKLTTVVNAPEPIPRISARGIGLSPVDIQGNKRTGTSGASEAE